MRYHGKKWTSMAMKLRVPRDGGGAKLGPAARSAGFRSHGPGPTQPKGLSDRRRFRQLQGALGGEPAHGR